MMATILSLPEEILTSVMHELTGIKTNDLKTLRLVCKAFAYNYEILKQLFDNINLVADVTWLDKLAKVDLAAFTPFVNSVTFTPPLFNWYIDKNTFHELINDSWQQDYGFFAPELPQPTASRFDEHSDNKYGDVRLSEQKKEIWAFWRYSMNAQRNRALLKPPSAVLALKWSQVLRLMTRCHTIQFRTIDYAILDSDLMPRYPTCLEDDRGDYEWTTKLPRRDLADLAFGSALEALGRSRIHIHSLDLAKPPALDILWKQNLGNDLLNLEALKQFKLRAGKDDDARCDSSLAVMNHKLFGDANYLLSKCNATIETLEVSGWTVFTWSASFEATPNLRKIVLESCDINNSMLIVWINSSAKLEEIIFDDVGLQSASAWGWKEVWDAIRDHKNRIWLTLDALYVDDCSLSFERFCTKAPRDDLDTLKFVDDAGLVASNALPMYLNHRLGWVDVLQDWFDLM